jgi:hypothetical protein
MKTWKGIASRLMMAEEVVVVRLSQLDRKFL